MVEGQLNQRRQKMDIRTIQSGVDDPGVSMLLDKILDDVLALKARLADSNRDLNSLGGILIPLPSPYNILIDTPPRTKTFLGLFVITKGYNRLWPF
jgi:hypothetical protein